jgi:isocitrate dehydrogenase kinase/phosphatase
MTGSGGSRRATASDPRAGAPGDQAGILSDSITTGYMAHRSRFAEVTRRALGRFRARDWAEADDDARERILLYDVAIHETLASIRMLLGDRPPDATAAGEARTAFASWARGEADAEIAETFFNSVIRRLFGTIGVDPGTEFVAEAVDDPPPSPASWTTTPLAHGFAVALHRLLEGLPFPDLWHEREERVRRAAELLHKEMGADSDWVDGTLETLPPLFFRNKAAYLVGRIRRGDHLAPLILAFTHPPEGVQLDAVLFTPDDASIVFGFTRSYLHADVGAPRATIEFLRSIMPAKRVDELYTAIGFHRHGKTELYRTLVSHLQDPDARFEPTPGQPGLVMSVFTMAGLNVVFKVIRDHFEQPKNTTRARVMQNYRLIFERDRVGRLADAQQFERLELPLDRFDAPVLDDLLDTAGRTVAIQGDTVTIEHLYTERRVRPLDLYLGEVDADEALRVTLDFGQAIKDLAAADIFPGDMLVKNFGVTRHGRVIFYDYDEVAPLLRCNFRRQPRAAYPEAEFAEDPSYYVGPDDVFPEEWRAFLGPPGPLRHALHQAHPELLDPDWWRGIQEAIRAGGMVDFYPYGPERRLGS